MTYASIQSLFIYTVFVGEVLVKGAVRLEFSVKVIEKSVPQNDAYFPWPRFHLVFWVAIPVTNIVGNLELSIK